MPTVVSYDPMLCLNLRNGCVICTVLKKIKSSVGDVKYPCHGIMVVMLLCRNISTFGQKYFSKIILATGYLDSIKFVKACTVFVVVYEIENKDHLGFTQMKTFTFSDKGHICQVSSTSFTP